MVTIYHFVNNYWLIIIFKTNLGNRCEQGSLSSFIACLKKIETDNTP